jgi:hypothetical protein
MKKVFVTKFLLFAVLSVCFTNCNRSKSVNGIVVSELLIIVSNGQGINYCKLLEKAINGDIGSIKQLSLLEFYDGIGYDHGSVIVDLIEIIGEDKFIQSLSTINKKQKQVIEGYIEAGLEYGNNPNIKSQTIKEAFPKIYTFLN